MNPLFIYYLASVGFLFLFSLSWAVMAVFYVQELGFNPLQLVLLGTALEIAALVFEVPTGAVADSYSRKISVIIGLAIMGVFFILQGILTGFLEVALLQMLAGLG